jgi:hypothetical protein
MNKHEIRRDARVHLNRKTGLLFSRESKQKPQRKSVRQRSFTQIVSSVFSLYKKVTRK